jgi:phage anti-repressor protein
MLIKPNCQPHQELTIQRNWQHWIHKKQDEDKQAKNQQYTKMMSNTDLTKTGGGGGGGGGG